MWAATAASYCPSRAGELSKQNMTKSQARWEGKLCNVGGRKTPLAPNTIPRKIPEWERRGQRRRRRRRKRKLSLPLRRPKVVVIVPPGLRNYD